MAKMIHTMIRVLDLDKSLTFYREAFDFVPSHTLDFPDFALVCLRNKENDVEIELTLNKGRTEPYTHGTGYGHYAYAVDDLEAKHAALSKLGYAPLAIKEFKRGDELLARFFFRARPRWLQDRSAAKIRPLRLNQSNHLPPLIHGRFKFDRFSVGTQTVRLKQ